MDSYDVVVVGAGPAGSTAAFHSAKAGARTLIIDKRRIPGKPVQCGEFLPALPVLRVLMPEAKALEELFEPANEYVVRETGTLRIVSPRGRKHDLELLGRTIERDKFDALLLGMAAEAGAEKRLGVRATGIDGDILLTSGGPVSAKVIIGADGPKSTIRRSAGLPEPKEIVPTVQYTIRGDFEDVVEMHFGNLAPGAYAWVIPKNGCANIGLGVKPRYLRGERRIVPILNEFVKNLGLETNEIMARTGGWVPASGPLKRTVSGNAILAGDAAGHVMATNGGGVPTGMVAGRAAGTAAARHVLDGMRLDGYEKAWRVEIDGMLRNAARTKWFADFAFGSDWRVETSMKILGTNGIRRAVLCKKTFVLF